MAYTNASIVAVTPEVKGYISEIYIANNQFVREGDKILQIDPTPYALAVSTYEAQLEGARLDLEIAQKLKQEMSDSKASYASQVDLASKTLERYKALLPQGFVSKESVDELINSQKMAFENLAKANAQTEQADLTIKKQLAAIKMLESTLAEAQYSLSKTNITAAMTGYINNFDLSTGNYLQPGEGICGIIDHKVWQIIADYQEGDLAHIHIGQKVLFYIPNFPWKIWSGRVKGIGRAVARTQIPQAAAVPYIEPVTDWIRYPYRFKVFISIDDLPEASKLFMGMSVYTLVIP